jgi:hypothetical protein
MRVTGLKAPEGRDIGNTKIAPSVFLAPEGRNRSVFMNN